MNYLVQWMDRAGFHQARFGNDLNGATTVALVLKATHAAQHVELFEETESATKRLQRF